MYKRVIALTAAIVGVLAGGSLATAAEAAPNSAFKSLGADGRDIFFKLPNGEWTRVAPQQVEKWLAERGQHSPHTTQFTSQQDLGNYYIGIALADVSETLRSQLKLDEGVGIAVATVGEETPAGEAGFLKYDVLVRVDGQDIVGHEALIDAVQRAGEEDRMLKLEYMRSGEMLEVELKPANRVADVDAEVRSEDEPGISLPENGQITPEWLLEHLKGSGNPAELQEQINQLRDQIKNLEGLMDDQTGDE